MNKAEQEALHNSFHRQAQMHLGKDVSPDDLGGIEAALQQVCDRPLTPTQKAR